MENENNFIKPPMEKPEEKPEQKSEMKKIKIVCAWCKKEMGEKEGTAGTEGKISHSICPECRKKLTKESDEFKKKNDPVI